MTTDEELVSRMAVNVGVISQLLEEVVEICGDNIKEPGNYDTLVKVSVINAATTRIAEILGGLTTHLDIEKSEVDLVALGKDEENLVTAKILSASAEAKEIIDGNEDEG